MLNFYSKQFPIFAIEIPALCYHRACAVVPRSLHCAGKVFMVCLSQPLKAVLNRNFTPE